MKEILGKIDAFCAYIIAIALILILLITSIDINSFNKNFYASAYKELETAETLGMTEKDLNLATNTLLDYLQGKRNDIKEEVSVQGVKMMAFNSKEEAHMIDVRNLYRFALHIRNISIVLLVVSLVYLLVRLRKGTWTLLSIQYMKTAILAAVFFAMLAGWAFVDFDAFWTTFHKIFFSNDLWLLDPATDLMINLFPADFFSKLVFRIVGMFVASGGALFLGGYFYLRHQLNKLKGNEDAA